MEVVPTNYLLIN